MKNQDYNYCTNAGQCKDPVAHKVLNKDRLGYCQKIVSLFIRFISRRKYTVVNLVVWDKKAKKIYKAKDFDL